jgi:hypothetical protein
MKGINKILAITAVILLVILSGCSKTGLAPKPGKGYTKDCGNEVIDKKEMCDDGAANTDNPDTDCYGGTFSYCNKDCQTKTASCDMYCGDGIINGDEDCDGASKPTCQELYGPDWGGSTQCYGCNLQDDCIEPPPVPQ